MPLRRWKEPVAKVRIPEHCSGAHLLASAECSPANDFTKAVTPFKLKTGTLFLKALLDVQFRYPYYFDWAALCVTHMLNLWIPFVFICRFGQDADQT